MMISPDAMPDIVEYSQIVIMKKIGPGFWNYKGYDIYLLDDIKSIEKYEIYKCCDFIQIVQTLKEAKQIIDGIKNNF